MRTFLAGFIYFIVILAAGFILGAIRVAVFAPALGNTLSVVLQLPFMLAVAWFACRSIVRLCSVPAVTGPRVAMGVIAFAFLMLSQFGLGEILGLSAVAQLQTYRTPAGLLGLVANLAYAAFPALQGSRTR